jgi:chemotaxis protein CheZ
MNEALDAAVRAAIREEIAPLLGELRRFVDRRIAELSAEFDAHVQLSDLSEEKLAGELKRIHATVANLVSVPARESRNSGIELEAVVLETEAATNRILEAAEAIQARLDAAALDAETAAALSAEVNAIFEACAFQDLTGQRIRRAIQHLEQVDDALRQFVPEAEPTERVTVSALMHTLPEGVATGRDLAQGEIDRVLGA